MESSEPTQFTPSNQMGPLPPLLLIYQEESAVIINVSPVVSVSLVCIHKSVSPVNPVKFLTLVAEAKLPADY